MTNSITGLTLITGIKLINYPCLKLLAKEIACEKAAIYIRICNEYDFN